MNEIGDNPLAIAAHTHHIGAAEDGIEIVMTAKNPGQSILDLAISLSHEGQNDFSGDL